MNAVTFKSTHRGWQTAFLNGADIGGLGKTTHSLPDQLWYWRAGIHCGYCATRGQAIAAIEAKVPLILEIKAKEAARKAEFNALPDHLKVLKTEMDRAEFERLRVWGRQPFDADAYRLASELASAAYTEFHVAHDRWLCQREAA